MIQAKSAAQAKAYYTDALQKSDYYVNGQELDGQFGGRLAQRIGISGVVTRDLFFDLCENRHPLSGDQLTPKMVDNRTVGYDINFHAPKAVSLLNAFSKDNHIQIAFEESVQSTMDCIEANMMTRVRAANRNEDRETKELAYASFTHLTARPVDGSTPDPHLHTHVFVFNSTFDEVEGKIKAGQFRYIKQDMPYYQAMFHKTLSDKLIDLGYTIKKTDKSFEIVGVPEEAIKLFSKRTNEIGRFAKEHGITGIDELGNLGARTRSKKQKGLTMDELRSEWRKQFKDNLNISEEEQNEPIRYRKSLSPDKLSDKQCIEYACDDIFERASVMPERKILASAYSHGIGSRSVTINDIDIRFTTDKSIIKVMDGHRLSCTHVDVLKEEKRMVELARKGQNTMIPLYSKPPKISLNGQQRDAVEHLLTTKDRVSIIMGAAGSGKTTLLKEAVDLIEKADKRVFVVAPSASASRGVLKSEGFIEADTVAKLLSDTKLHEKLPGQVIYCDEAGLLANKEMSSLLELADRYNARLLLGGDTRQHSSVARGDALRVINTVAGIRAAEVSKIYRQRNADYKKAVEYLSVGNVAAGFETLDRMGAIREIDHLKPHDELTNDYIKAAKARKTVLVVSPTREQGTQISEAIREKLKNAGLIGKREIAVKKLENRNFTEAERGDWRNLKTGQVVQFTQNVPKMKRGSVWTIADIQNGQVSIKDDNGTNHVLPLNRAKNYNIYEQSELILSKGDCVRITQNGFDLDGKRLDNGDCLQVASIAKSGKTVLVNPVSKSRYEVDNSFGHINLDYCTTSHSSQGKTVDQVLVAQGSASFSATDAKQFYVSVSRGKTAVSIYTDDKKELLEHAKALKIRRSSIELIEGNKGLEHALYLERQRIPTTNKSAKSIDNPRITRDYEPEL